MAGRVIGYDKDTQQFIYEDDTDDEINEPSEEDLNKNFIDGDIKGEFKMSYSEQWMMNNHDGQSPNLPDAVNEDIKILSNKARNELKKKYLIKIQLQELKLGINKDAYLTKLYNYHHDLLKYDAIKNPKIEIKEDNKKDKKNQKRNDLFITINFEDHKILKKDGTPNYKKLVSIMKRILNWSWVKDTKEVIYQLECRGLDDKENYYGIHIHICLFGTQHQKKQIKGEYGLITGFLQNYVKHHPSIDCKLIWNRKGLEQYISEDNLKKDPKKRAKQKYDRLLQIEYNKHIKDNMLKSNEVQQDEDNIRLQITVEDD